MFVCPAASKLSTVPESVNLKFPDSPYELHQPFPPAVAQPEAIAMLVERV